MSGGQWIGPAKKAHKCDKPNLYSNSHLSKTSEGNRWRCNCGRTYVVVIRDSAMDCYKEFVELRD